MKKRGLKNSKLIIILSLFLVIFILSLFYGEITGFLGLTSVNTCSDTDFGKNYEIKGEISGKFYEGGNLESKSYYEEDKCLSQNVLVEYYCVAVNIHSYKSSVKYECRYGCKEGKCLVPEGLEKPAMPCNLWCELKRFFGIF